jgi:hypothetical protein
VEQDAIGRQERPAERVAARRRAHAELQSRGYSGKALEQVASTLRDTNDRRFFLEALERWARSDGYRAFLAAFDSAEPLRSAALRTVGAALVEHDPNGALAAAERLPDELRYLYSQDLFAAWSLIDSKALVRYLESVEIDSITQRLIVDMRDVLREYPVSARAIESRLPNVWRGQLGSEFR